MSTLVKSKPCAYISTEINKNREWVKKPLPPVLKIDPCIDTEHHLIKCEVYAL